MSWTGARRHIGWQRHRLKADPHRHGCRSTTVIAIDFARRIVLIGASAYAGERKRSVFTYLDDVLPAADVMPVHGSANAGLDGTGDSPS